MNPQIFEKPFKTLKIFHLVCLIEYLIEAPLSVRDFHILDTECPRVHHL